MSYTMFPVVAFLGVLLAAGIALIADGRNPAGPAAYLWRTSPVA